MPRGRIVTGDHARLPVRLRKAGATFDASAATIVAAIVTENHSDKLSGDVTQDSGANGADWANSLIIVEFPPAETGRYAHNRVNTVSGSRAVKRA